LSSTFYFRTLGADLKDKTPRTIRENREKGERTREGPGEEKEKEKIEKRGENGDAHRV